MRRIERIVLEEWLAADANGRAVFPARVPVSRAAIEGARAALPDRSAGQLAAGGAATRTCRSSCRAGRTRRSATSSPRTASAGGFKSVHTVKRGIEYMIALADWYRRDQRRRRRSASSRSAAASPATFRSASCRCCTRTCGCRTSRSGATSARSATRRRATARTRAPCRTRRSRGASSAMDTPKYIIESDATIVAPLIFAKVLGW